MDMTYLTPEQRQRDYLKELMESTMQELAVQDNIQSDLINAIIRVQLKRLAPLTAKYADYEQIETIAKRIVDVAEGACEVVVSDYDILAQVLLDQPGEVIRIGRAKKNEYFAIVDISGAIAGVYIPKAPRQIMIEKRVEDAICKLEEFLASYGRKLFPEVRNVLVNYLYDVKYPPHIPHIKIFACNRPIEGADEVSLSHGRVLQLKYELQDESRAILWFFMTKDS